MSIPIFSGQCPQCESSNTEVNMRENNMKFWECPECHLQLLIENDKAVIFRSRGTSTFIYRESKLKSSHFFEETGEDSYRNQICINDYNHLKYYIEHSVSKPLKYSLINLIESFVSYKYKNDSKKKYLDQSDHFKIDFEDISIKEKLRNRDKERNYNNLYAQVRLYDFLMRIFEKYSRNDNSWLPEMGMSKIEHYLCLKHFPTDSAKLINSNPLYVQQSLRDLIEDLIQIIYQDEKLILSYDMNEFYAIEMEMTT